MPTCFREQMRACINNSLHIPCLYLGSQQPLQHWCSTETRRPGCEHVKSHCLGVSGRHSSRVVLLRPVSMLWTQIQVEKSHATRLACSYHGARSFRSPERFGHFFKSPRKGKEGFGELSTCSSGLRGFLYEYINRQRRSKCAGDNGLCVEGTPSLTETSLSSGGLQEASLGFIWPQNTLLY